MNTLVPLIETTEKEVMARWIEGLDKAESVLRNPKAQQAYKFLLSQSQSECMRNGGGHGS